MPIYKIRNKLNGKFYSQLNPNYWDFTNSKWNKTGKTWNKSEDIIKIVKWFKITGRNEELTFFIDNCEIVELDLVETRKINFEI